MPRGTKLQSQHIPYGIDSGHALEVISHNLLPNPYYFIRELISNAIDASIDAPIELKRIQITTNGRKSLTIRDYGVGISQRNAEEVLPVFFKSTKGKGGREIGIFGIGLYACLQYSTQVIVLTKTEEDKWATKAILGHSGVKLQSVRWKGPGTEITLELSDKAPSLVTDGHQLSLFIQSIFPFAPVDIHLDSVLIAGPSRFDPPWHQSGLSGGWSPFTCMDESNTSAPAIEFVIRQEHEIADFALFLTAQPVPTRHWNLQLFVKRVRVGDNYRPLDQGTIVTFLAGVINAHDLDLTLARDSVIKESPSVNALDELFFEVLGDGLSRFAEEMPQSFGSFVNEHRHQLLTTCLRIDSLRTRIQEHLPFRTINGEWRPLAVAKKHGKAYYTESTDHVDVPSGDPDNKPPVFLFGSDVERAFLTRLLAGSMKGVRWIRSEQASDDPESRNYFLAEQVKSALKTLGRLTTPSKTSKTELKSNLRTVRSEVTSAMVVDNPKDRRAAYIIPELRPGRNEEDVWRKARERVIENEEHGESGYRFESAVRRQGHEDGYNKILCLNKAHPLVPAFFDLLGSPRQLDQKLGAYLLGGLLSIARNESYDDWMIWTTDFDYSAKHLMNLAIIALDMYRLSKGSERSL